VQWSYLFEIKLNLYMYSLKNIFFYNSVWYLVFNINLIVDSTN
jgi:hypothetical protein